MTRLKGRLAGGLAGRPTDWVTAGALFAVIAAQFVFTRHLLPGERPASPITWILAAALCAPVLTYRRYPRASLAACLTVLLGYAAGRWAAFPVLPVVALTFGITLHSNRAMALAALIAPAVTVPVAVAFQPRPVSSPGVVAFCEIMIVVAWVIAESLRTSRQRLAWMRARAEQIELERAEEAQRAVIAERLRIARELHDVVAHSMSVIAVQSAVGNHVMDAQPEQARHALAAIEATSRSALAEMRRLLGVLRQEGDPQGALAPAPGLADLGSLVTQVQKAGVTVWLQVTGERAALPPSIDMSAYRVIQEALTNVIKHAAPAPASVKVSYAPAAVTVEVADDGPARPGQQAPAPPPGHGHGLIGMRERVAVFGGELVAGPRPEGGFLVRAQFPLEAVPG